MKTRALALLAGLLIALASIAATSTPNLDALDYWHLADTTNATRARISSVNGGDDGGLYVTFRNGTVVRLLSGERLTTISDEQLGNRLDALANLTGYDIAYMCFDRADLSTCRWKVGKIITIEEMEHEAGEPDELP